MKVSVSIKTLFVLNQIMMQNPELARQVTSLAPEGELPLAELCDCLDKVTSQLIKLESMYFGTSLQASSQRVRAAIKENKFYRVQEFKGQTMHWSSYTLEGLEIYREQKFDNRSTLDQLMFNQGWVFVPEYL